jgi:hypothetical protein
VTEKSNCRTTLSFSSDHSSRVTRPTSDQKHCVWFLFDQKSKGIDGRIDAFLSIKPTRAEHHRRLGIDRECGPYS